LDPGKKTATSTPFEKRLADRAAKLKKQDITKYINYLKKFDKDVLNKVG